MLKTMIFEIVEVAMQVEWVYEASLKGLDPLSSVGLICVCILNLSLGSAALMAKREKTRVRYIVAVDLVFDVIYIIVFPLAMVSSGTRAWHTYASQREEIFNCINANCERKAWGTLWHVRTILEGLFVTNIFIFMSRLTPLCSLVYGCYMITKEHVRYAVCDEISAQLLSDAGKGGRLMPQTR